MELRKGYKQSTMEELRTPPSAAGQAGKRRLPGLNGEREKIKLGDISKIKTGKKNNEDKVEDGAYPFFVRSQTVERINSYSFDGEAILVPGEGGIGSIVHYINGKFDYHQRVYKISDFIDDICGKFIYFYMVQYFGKQAMRNTVKATVDSLRLPTFQEFEIIAPSFEEQQAIAAALSDVDALLAALDALIAKKRLIKQGAMRELLTGKKRLPGFNGEWETKKLGDVASINMGQSPDSENYNQGGIGIPLIQGNADIDNRKTIRRVWTTQITKTCDEKDLILTVRAPVGSIGIASEYSCLGRGVCSLKPMDADASFLFHAMVFSENKWKVLEQGSTFTSANSAQIAEFPLMTAPTNDEQQAIAEILSDMDAEIAALEQKRAKTRLLKQGMLQELLTGRIRLV